MTNIFFIDTPGEKLKITARPGDEKIVVIFMRQQTSEKHLHIDIHPSHNSKIYVLLACLLTGDARLRLSTNQLHNAPQAWSDFLCKSVLYDKTHFSYDGRIHITKKGQQSHAYQRNENLTLSNNCSVYSKPNLEIEANDVFCTHGATTGYMGDDELFYLQTRGMHQKKAQEMYAEGFLFSLVDKLIQAGVETNAINKFHHNFSRLIYG